MEREIPEKAGELLERAMEYDRIGDVYQAVKLFKRVIRLAPEWLQPYVRLAAIYKGRLEWKSALHYAKKAVSLDAANQQVWWDMGLAASALGKDRLARSVWQKFGVQEEKGKLISLQVRHSGIFELAGAHTLDPSRAQLSSIPHPDSGLRYRDVLLFDREIVGYHMAGKYKIPIYAALQRIKASYYKTFTCVLQPGDQASMKTLDKLCANVGIGWEVWSDTVWASSAVSGSQKPEYYSRRVFDRSADTGVWIALAAMERKAALETLRNWAVISLGEFFDFEEW